MNIDDETFNKVGNKLTEYSGDYKWINPHILVGYYGLPKSFPKLSAILFGFLMKTKFYKDKALTKEINEERRIYTDILITIEDILGEWNNGKYTSKQDMITDISNMKKRIREMDDNNVFYCWKYKDIYTFVMERDIRVWKFYNSCGKITPKTMKKISAIGSDMINCMIKHVRKTHDYMDKIDIENSFGLFINRLIDKMNHLVATEIPKWDGKQDIYEYLVVLNNEMKNMENYKGLTFDPDILNKFPASISKKLSDDMAKELNMKTGLHKEEKVNNLEKDITPVNANLVKAKKSKKNILNLNIKSSTKPIIYEYSGEVNPFADARQFVRYYHAFLQQCTGGKIKFDSYEADSVYATQILDLLIENHRSSNKIFLNAWLKYFYEYHLKGSKANKIKYTSLNTLRETFDKFNASRFFDVTEKLV